MKPFRVLVVSGSRPSRTRKIADILTRQIPGVEISGIAQVAWKLLPPEQRWMARGANPYLFSVKSRIALWFQSILESGLHGVLWFLHGCPKSLNSHDCYTIADLAGRCRQIGCQFIVAEDFDARRLVPTFGADVSLIVVTGDWYLDPRLSALSSCGVLRVRQTDVAEAVKSRQNVHIAVEFFNHCREGPYTLASIDLPIQPFDGTLGLTLKTNLIADDLLVESVKLLQHASPEEASHHLARWVERIIAPYLRQLEKRTWENAPALPPAQRYRRISRLVLDSLLLCSPIQVGRNWLRRLRGKYPVLILTHHLVSDRPHRMGTPTECFWHILQFLRRHYCLLSLADAETKLQSGKVTTPIVVVTFDDGYRDNFINLRAVMQEIGASVTLLVSTKPVDEGKEFEHDLGFGQTGHLALTWDQIVYWQSNGGEFGSHTRTHLDCGCTDEARLRWEIAGSKRDLEGRLSQGIRFFAFPFGHIENMSQTAIAIAAQTYPVCLTGLDGENLPLANQSTYLFRKHIYPNRWELELELQSIFLTVNGWREKLRRRSRVRRWEQRAADIDPASAEM